MVVEEACSGEVLGVEDPLLALNVGVQRRAVPVVVGLELRDSETDSGSQKRGSQAQTRACWRWREQARGGEEWAQTVSACYWRGVAAEREVNSGG